MPHTNLKPKPAEQNTHRRYLDPAGTNPVACRAVTADILASLAAAADQIEIRQPLGGGWIPEVTINRILEGLRAVPLLKSDQVTDAGLALQRLRRWLGDSLARLRIRYGRHILAGELHQNRGGSQERVLVLVLAQSRILSCDWLLTPNPALS